eukprot:SM000363S13640  [mRNA]  locus=s363:33364:34897:+ [translate_table: standard]
MSIGSVTRGLEGGCGCVLRSRSNSRSGDSNFAQAAEACMPLILRALRASQEGRFPRDYFLNVDVPRDTGSIKGMKVTRQGSSRIVPRWEQFSAARRRTGMQMAGTALNSQLAQLGLAASAAGAARRNMLKPSGGSPSGTADEETESVAQSSTVASAPAQKLTFRNEASPFKPAVLWMFVETDFADEGEDVDRHALGLGWITVTPLGLLTRVSQEAQVQARIWTVDSLVSPA